MQGSPASCFAITRTTWTSFAWQQSGPPEFHYRGGGVQVIKRKQVTVRLAESPHGEGFLDEYGKASREEDFNSDATRLHRVDPAL